MLRRRRTASPNIPEGVRIAFLLLSILKMLVVFSIVMVGVALLTLMERKVSAWMQKYGFNSYFVDCDATGELFDNYSPLYPATKELDMKKRLERMAWIRDTYRVVVGSEVGAWFAAPEIHFGHGMMTVKD